jgi:hypothetical protein
MFLEMSVFFRVDQPQGVSPGSANAEKPGLTPCGSWKMALSNQEAVRTRCHTIV